jgi:HTH-type transcriptional regulator/antitoxin HipB
MGVNLELRTVHYFPIGKQRPNHALSTPNIPDREISLALSPVVADNFPNGKLEQAMTSIRSPQQLGDALRAARKQLGLTQPQLALAAGVGVRFIVDLEAGKPTLRLENVLRVIDALGGEIQLSGLPSSLADDQREGGDHGA